eukprot:5564689-Prymnesium_polylepis.1
MADIRLSIRDGPVCSNVWAYERRRCFDTVSVSLVHAVARHHCSRGPACDRVLAYAAGAHAGDLNLDGRHVCAYELDDVEAVGLYVLQVVRDTARSATTR